MNQSVLLLYREGVLSEFVMPLLHHLVIEVKLRVHIIHQCLLFHEQALVRFHLLKSLQKHLHLMNQYEVLVQIRGFLLLLQESLLDQLNLRYWCQRHELMSD